MILHIEKNEHVFKIWMICMHIKCNSVDHSLTFDLIAQAFEVKWILLQIKWQAGHRYIYFELNDHLVEIENFYWNI